MRRRVFTLYAYKFCLSGALILLLDRRCGCSGERSAVVLADTDSGGSAEELAALTGNAGALLVLRSSRSGAHKMEPATGTLSGILSLRNLKGSPVARRRPFFRSILPFSVGTRFEFGVSATCWTILSVQVPLAGLKTRVRSSGNSEESGCRAILSYCTFCWSCLNCSLAMSPSAERALTQQVDLSDILGDSEALQVKVNHD